MAGVIFMINVPKKQYEEELKNNQTNLMLEREQSERKTKIIDELKEKQRNQSGDVRKSKSVGSLPPKSGVHMEKSNGANVVDGYTEGNESQGKVWGEIKQVMKPKKKKLVINKPLRGVDLLAAFHWDTPLETILPEVVSRLDIRNVVWNSTKDDNFWQVVFSLESSYVAEELLQVLRTFGIGSKYQSSVSLVPCTLYFKSNDQKSRPTSKVDYTRPSSENTSNSPWSRFSSSVRSRTNLAQVLHDVRSNAALTFDWVFLLFVAAFVSAIGLVENSGVIIVASVIISPLMSPITAATLGTVVRDRSLQRMGVLNEFLGLFLCVLVGFIFGLIISIIDEQFGIVDDWPTQEMTYRCEFHSLWVGILVAFPTGAAVALAVLGWHTSSLVGVAISASLLPPAVNAGLLWSMSLVRVVCGKSRWSHTPAELAVLGAISLCLTLINILCIFLSGIAVYKVKEVRPLDKRDISWWRANRIRLQETIDTQEKETEQSLDWDIYNRWCNETFEGKPDIERRGTFPAVVHSDTVTYRRRASAMPRFRVQNIENYCSQKSEDIYTPLSKSDEMKGQNDDASTGCDVTNNTTNNCEDRNHSYYNLSFNNDEDTEGANQHPTIEPSLSYTKDSTKYTVVLGNKPVDI